jgi:putative hemolysin
MGNPLIEIGIILALTIANGLFAASELALVSAKKSRLETLANRGNRAARGALRLAERPGAMLATVQIGITLIGVINSIFAGENLVKYLEPPLEPLLGTAAGTVSYVLIVLFVTFASLIIGELAPKRIALRGPEALAMLVAPLMTVLAAVARPLVWILDRTTDGLLRLFGIRGETPEHVTEEDVKALVEQATESGNLESEESALIERVLRFTDRRARDLMTPRVDLVKLDLDLPSSTLIDRAIRGGYTRYPVYRGDPDDLLGFLYKGDLLEIAVDPRSSVDQRVRPAVFVPEVAWANDVLAKLHDRSVFEALVVDEFGVVAGMVTANDLINELVGVFGDREEQDSSFVRREDGSYLVDGGLAMHEVRQHLPLPATDDERYATLAGFILHHAGHIPSVGEQLDVERWRFEVLDLDGNRIDRVSITPPTT